MAAFCVGLTGGIASGKTAVSDLFSASGATVVDADVVSREVVARGSPGLAAVVAYFGSDVLGADGDLDRKRMRARVFANDTDRRALESIVHPLVRAHTLDACTGASGPYVIAAIPLLAEGGGRAAYPWLDRVAVVDVDTATQLGRLVARDGIDAALAQKMLAAQASRAERLALADDVLVNTSTLDLLRVGVGELDRRYRMLAAIKAQPAG